MNRKLLATLAGGALALTMVGGTVFAGSSLTTRSNAAPRPAIATSLQAGEERPERRGKGEHKGKERIVHSLVGATIDVTGLSRREVMDGLIAGQSLAQIAEAHGKSADDIVQAARTKIQEKLNQAVANNKITQQVADEALAKFDQNAPQVMSDTSLGQKIGREVGKRHPLAGALIKATADVTGMTATEVVQELRAGKSLAQIAQEHGKTADDILAKLRERGGERLDKALDRAKELIDQPGLGRGAPPSNAPPSGEENR